MTVSAVLYNVVTILLLPLMCIIQALFLMLVYKSNDSVIGGVLSAINILIIGVSALLIITLLMKIHNLKAMLNKQ